MIAKSFTAQGRELEGGLRDARDQHADGQTENLPVQFPAQSRRQEQDRGDHHQVEHDRARRGNEEVTARIEHSHEHGGKTDHQHVGKHHAQQLQHEAGVRLKFARRQDQGITQHHQPDDGGGGDHHSGNHGVGRAPHLPFVLIFFLRFKNRNERRRQSSFA